MLIEREGLNKQGESVCTLRGGGSSLAIPLGHILRGNEILETRLMDREQKSTSHHVTISICFVHKMD